MPIRPTRPEDTPALVALADETGVFRAAEIQALREVLADYHSTHQSAGHRCVIAADAAGQAEGFVYFAPAAMTAGTWHIWWIVVARSLHGRGIGSTLLRHAEEEVRRALGRMLLIETSSLPHYRPTRRFYEKHGYEPAALLHDYYAPGDDLVIFRKRLEPAAPSG
jgi:ribosomal protein S18 acetylase RimI-like enzyme